MKNIKQKEENIIKDMRILFRLQRDFFLKKKEIDYTATKYARNLFRL